MFALYNSCYNIIVYIVDYPATASDELFFTW